ncbi:MAG: DNA/RNA non-specific endonuclease [Polyangiaceae bacterium]
MHPSLVVIARLFLLAALSLGAGCVNPYSGAEDEDIDERTEPLAAPSLAEGFESASKTAYSAADIALDSGLWRMDDALIGTSAGDVKQGARSARVRNSGKITMRFDHTGGAGTVSIAHARYGNDGAGTWGLFRSVDQGASWSQVGAAVTTTTQSLATATFTVSFAGAVRFEIRKLDGGSNRINFDEIILTEDDPDADDPAGDGPGAALSVHTTMGIPSPSSAADYNSYLSVKSGYVLSYDGSRKVPRWVSWELNASYLGTAPRQDDFRTDNTFPAALPQAKLSDYSGSGYDRGHLCPSAERTLTVAANSQTFYLTNMVPQAPNSNQGPWASLENEVRKLATQGRELFITAGSVFGASTKSVGKGVRVPESMFKVIVVLDAVGQGAASVTASTRVISVMVPNDNAKVSKSAPWRKFRVSVDTIEAQTGYDLLSDVDPAIQSVVESQVDAL